MMAAARRGSFMLDSQECAWPERPETGGTGDGPDGFRARTCTIGFLRTQWAHDGTPDAPRRGGMYLLYTGRFPKLHRGRSVSSLCGYGRARGTGPPTKGRPMKSCIAIVLTGLVV